MLTRTPDLQKVTCVHKANIMKLGDGLFLNTFRRIAEEYKLTGIQYNDMIVDNTYVSRPLPICHLLSGFTD